MAESDRFRGCLLGLAAGDAVGTAVEFRPRGSFAPVTDMVGGGPFGLEPGEWTDDTSMALCLAASLVETGAFDARDQMERYARWRSQGYLSSNGRCFDIGNTVARALDRYQATGNPFSGSTDSRSAGNGSIMRLAPVVLFAFPDQDQIARYAAESSRTTHGAAECLDACRLLGSILFRALSGADKDAVLFDTPDGLVEQHSIRSIANGDYRDKAEGEIVGTGYVVNSLEAALWCFHRTDSFEEAILMATNLGDDADTTAAICGQVAGAYYGESGIPARWLAKLAMREYIRELTDRLRAMHPRA
ncbi:MAG: ADP-ribosylglycohydrolase family protein [Chloroflexi bacterium]|nr:ADP-ribosylglycohydrolase family protein [Chloroflexota bacterium]